MSYDPVILGIFTLSAKYLSKRVGARALTLGILIGNDE